VLGLVWGPAAITTPLAQVGLQRVMLVVLENADYDAARVQPFLAKLAGKAACSGDRSPWPVRPSPTTWP
jgi:precorrin-6B methylase 1